MRIPLPIKGRLVSIGKGLCIALFALSESLSDAQSPNKTLQFNHFSINHRIPQNSFTCALQDKKGYLWFGTYNGLLKYDGYTVSTFHPDPFNENSLPDNEVHHLYEDAKGNIWIAGTQGISKYDPHSGIFTSYHHNAANKSSLPDENVNCMVQDKEGKTWIGTNAG